MCKSNKDSLFVYIYLLLVVVLNTPQGIQDSFCNLWIVSLGDKHVCVLWFFLIKERIGYKSGAICSLCTEMPGSMQKDYKHFKEVKVNPRPLIQREVLAIISISLFPIMHILWPVVTWLSCWFSCLLANIDTVQKPHHCYTAIKH